MAAAGSRVSGGAAPQATPPWLAELRGSMRQEWQEAMRLQREELRLEREACRRLQEEKRATEERVGALEQRVKALEGQLRGGRPADGAQELTAHLAQCTLAPSSSSSSSPLSARGATPAPPALSPAELHALGEQLMAAAESGSEAQVRRLVDAGADLNFTDPNVRTPLMNACLSQNEPVVSLLLRLGADVHQRAHDAMTALHFAALKDTGGRCVRMLLNAGAHVDCRERRGCTPLHLAAIAGNVEAAFALLAAGASKTRKEQYGKLPFQSAREPALQNLLRP